MTTKYLTGTVYTGVVGALFGDARACVSIERMQRRNGDSLPNYLFPTKGYEGREQHVQSFLESDHRWLLFLDSDMEFQPDTLERLRRHGRAAVSGRYVRRTIAPMMPIWFENDDTFQFPMRPMVHKPPRGQLVPLGATGFGCLLVHRVAFDGMKPLLRGRRWILEHDMAVEPYDLGKVLAGEEQLVPLRGDFDTVMGSDLRFCYYLRKAGFTLWGDADVDCKHYISYGIAGQRDYDNLSDDKPGDIGNLRRAIDEDLLRERAKIAQRLADLVAERDRLLAEQPVAVEMGGE